MLIASAVCFTAFVSLFFNHNKSRIIVCRVALFAISSCIVMLMAYLSLNINAKTSIIYFNNIAYYIKLVLCICTFVWIVLNKYNILQIQNMNLLFLSLLVLILAIMGMLLTFNLLVIFLCCEMYSLALGITTISTSNLKAGIRYITISVIMSAMFLYGISLFYHNFGTLSICNIHAQSINIYNHLITAALLIPYILFKLHIAPFHTWVIDLYDKSKLIIISYIDTCVKFCVFCFIAYLVFKIQKGNVLFVNYFMFIPSILSMLIGGFAPIITQDLKKLIAYSSIGHVGFALALLSIDKNISFVYSITYMFIYTISAFCFFVGLVKVHKLFALKTINDIDGVASKYPAYAIIMIAGLVSMSGMPPFALFVAKLNIFMYIIQTKNIFLLCIAILYSILTICYTIRIIKHMCREGKIGATVVTDGKATCFITILLLVIINTSFPAVQKTIKHMILSQRAIYQKNVQSLELSDIYALIKKTFMLENHNITANK